MAKQATETERKETSELTRFNQELDPSDRAGGTSMPGTQFYGICQRRSENETKVNNPGKFFTKNEDGDIEIVDKLEVVVLDSSPRSTRFSDDGQVVCRSYDGLTGMSGKECRNCEYFAFSDSNVSRENRCKNSYVLLCVQAADWHEEAFFAQIPPSGIRDWKVFANDLQNRYKRPVFSVRTTITTEERKAKIGKSFVPVFTVTEAYTIEQTEVLREVRNVEARRFRPQEEPEDRHYSNTEDAFAGEEGLLICQNQDCEAVIEPYTSKEGNYFSPTDIANYSMDHYGRVLCKACQINAKKTKQGGGEDESTNEILQL